MPVRICMHLIEDLIYSHLNNKTVQCLPGLDLQAFNQGFDIRGFIRMHLIYIKKKKKPLYLCVHLIYTEIPSISRELRKFPVIIYF